MENSFNAAKPFLRTFSLQQTQVSHIITPDEMNVFEIEENENKTYPRVLQNVQPLISQV